MYLKWKDLDFKDEKQCKFVKSSEHKWRIEYKYVYLDDGSKTEVVWLIDCENNCLFCKFYDVFGSHFDSWKFEVID